MRGAAGNNHDPAVSRTDALPIAGPVAALDLELADDAGESTD